MTSAVLGSTIVRHQMASFAASAVDFGTMIGLVELLRVAPPTATLIGALSGAVVNFWLNRRHTFPDARTGEPSSQMVRYGLVSSMSAVLNALGVKWGTRVLGVPYVLVRAVVALAVGLGWNYPLHRSFVFRVRAAP